MSSDCSKLLDPTGWRILEVLQENCRISYKELGRRVGLSTPAVIERVRRMEEEGIIEGYRAVVNPRKVGYSFRVMLAVSSVYNNPDHVVMKALEEVPEVIRCWSVTGSNDFYMEALIPSMEFLQELLTKLSQHGRIVTSIVLPVMGGSGRVTPPRERP
ncbi:transcriptional regulator [Thermanaerovibrio velox DSM 12556]|uniref:Transcriptional regulator n=1 Tax=Thermanaerovibrio velox DSM 12556 TaxID=926567 RepID=H0UR20_9BACT|nr:Lrp/AsnC family transcriptional regulator [Thermanaerovibrio velox]EHM10857.1 transcriptional regulator [Thermanaerovibrio velox DSM 12556]